ncbi:hypothetical protein HDV62DRAFT_265922 [Trichoderma sp. SZMC 28011]
MPPYESMTVLGFLMVVRWLCGFWLLIYALRPNISRVWPSPLSWPSSPHLQPLVSPFLVYLLFVLYRPLNSTPTPVDVCKPRSTDHQTLPMQGSLTGRLVPSSLPSCSAPPCLSFRLAKPASCLVLGSSVLSSITPEPYSRSCQKAHRRVKPLRCTRHK